MTSIKACPKASTNCEKISGLVMVMLDPATTDEQVKEIREKIAANCRICTAGKES